MRSLGVVLVPEAVEDTLLQVHSLSHTRADGICLQRSMDALVPVVLRGSSTLSAFGSDAQLHPPDGQRADTKASRERRAVVRPEDLREAMLLEESIERDTASFFIRMRQSLAPQEVSTVSVGDRERIALGARAQPEPALEVRTPNRIRRVLRRESVGILTRPLLPPLRYDAALPLQNRTDGRR
jgi:hypothetical protein